MIQIKFLINTINIYRQQIKDYDIKKYHCYKNSKISILLQNDLVNIALDLPRLE